MEAHANLFNPKSSEDFSLQTKLVIDNYKANRLIFEELNHYKLDQTRLGKHPVFDWFKRVQQIRSMKVADLFRIQQNTLNMLGKARRLIVKEPHSHNTNNRLERIVILEKELKEITQLLNL